MEPNLVFAKLAPENQVQQTMKALTANGFTVDLVESGAQAKEKVLEIVPPGAEVLTMTSVTLDSIGITSEINESVKYNSIQQKLYSMDRKSQGRSMAELRATPDWVVGSVHAVTQDGQLLIASNTGSQLPAYAYSGGSVIFVVGTQKLVKDTAKGIKRIYEYSYPLEDVRSQKAYGMRSGVNKILIINRELAPGRIHVILVKEKLGF